VRQGDPVLPILLNYAVEDLDAILGAAKGAGHLSWVVPYLIPGGIIHLQYNDDMIIMI
jgi:hypothetical protein